MRVMKWNIEYDEHILDLTSHANDVSGGDTEHLKEVTSGDASYLRKTKQL